METSSFLAALLPPDLIDFVFHSLAEPLGIWDELMPGDLVCLKHLQLFFNGGSNLAPRIPEGIKWPAGLVMFEPIVKSLHPALDLSGSIGRITAPPKNQPK